MFTHRMRLLIIGGILTILLSATLLFETPEPTLSVDELMTSPSAKEGKEVAIRGEVVNGTIDGQNFSFSIRGEVYDLVIDYSQASVSNGLEDGRTVYAQGILEYSTGQWIFNAEVIKTSCPSKYDETET